MNIGVDVDLTLLDPICCQGGWQDWLQERSIYNYPRGSLKDYYIPKYYPDVDRPLDFWSQPNLYQGLLPYQHSVEVITELAETYNIYFISYCKKGHFGSKVEWIKEHYKLPEGRFHFAATKQKHMCNVDVMVDDRLEYLCAFPNRVDKLLFKSNYDQVVSIDKRVILVEDWLMVKDYIKNEYEQDIHRSGNITRGYPNT